MTRALGAKVIEVTALCDTQVTALEAAAEFFPGASGSHHADPRGEAYHDDSATLLGRLASGGLVEVRVDMVSDRPHAMDQFELQGTDGAYECARESEGRVWLRELDASPEWRPLAEAFEAVRSARGISPLESVPSDAGHGGGDYFVLRDFIMAIREEREPATDVHRALDLTLPGLVSMHAIESEQWFDVPDSRHWVAEKRPTGS